uniref:N-glycosylase/DNA lyase n=1 Tax=Timema californicum TaxID=61474 RepID=A0A7R9JIJ0_TIMCA|nr:unnamed protein product [Timema californicum]
MKLPGIGAKVADCICLMSLGHLDAIPVDTHIYQVASQRYLPHLKNYKSVTNKVYNEIGEYFRDLYEKYAGWAHTVAFVSNMKFNFIFLNIFVCFDYRHTKLVVAYTFVAVLLLLIGRSKFMALTHGEDKYEALTKMLATEWEVTELGKPVQVYQMDADMACSIVSHDN